MKSLFLRMLGIIALATFGLPAGVSSLNAAEKNTEKPVKIVTAEAFAVSSSDQGKMAYRKKYGVAYLRVEATGGKFSILPDRPWSRLSEKNQRALSPVFLVSDAAKKYRSQADRPHHADTLEAYFLFQGKEPLKLKWTLPDGQVVEQTLTPTNNETRQGELLGEWWKRFGQTAKLRAEADAYSPEVENYLVAMLAERLGFSPPVMQNPWSGRRDVDSIFGLLLGAESIRAAMQRDTILKNTRRDQPLNRDLPKAVAPPAITLPEFDRTAVAVEPIAGHVPAECFYLRCGNFKNFQWLRSNLTEWGGMARDLTGLRGENFGIQARLEHQLALKKPCSRNSSARR